MKILITGANGQLGSRIRIASQQAPDEYIFTDVAELDITDARAVDEMMRLTGAQVIVNCAAYTDVDKAEADPEKARLLNAEAPRVLASAAKRFGAMLIHISTDYVFGGNCVNIPLREEDAPAPTGVYGITKLEGEKAIAAEGARAIIIRTAWLYSEFGRNFLKTMLRLTTEKPELNVVFDQTGSPTCAQDLAEAIVGIINRRQLEGYEGIYHFSNEGVCSWYDFALAIAGLSGHTACRIHPCHSSEFPSPVKRPAYSVLDKTKFKQTFNIEIPHWHRSLARCLNNIISHEA